MTSEPIDSIVLFPVDGDNTSDTITVSSESTGEEVRFPRLWQTFDGLIDLSDVLQGMVDQREDAIRQWDQVGLYYDVRHAFLQRLASKLEALDAAAKAQDEEQVERLLASLTSVEYAEIDELMARVGKHPEWPIADVGDADVDGDHD